MRFAIGSGRIYSSVVKAYINLKIVSSLFANFLSLGASTNEKHVVSTLRLITGSEYNAGSQRKPL
jgi:hypothetical protein